MSKNKIFLTLLLTSLVILSSSNLFAQVPNQTPGQTPAPPQPLPLQARITEQNRWATGIYVIISATGGVSPVTCFPTASSDGAFLVPGFLSQHWYVYLQSPGVYSISSTCRDSRNMTASTTYSFTFNPAPGAALPQDYALVANHQSDSVWVMNLQENKFTANIPVGRRPINVALSPDGKTAVVTNNFSNTVSFLDTQNQSVVATTSVGSQPWDVKFTPDGSKILVTNSGSGTVSVLSAASRSVIATLPVGYGARNIVLNRKGTTAWVLNTSSGTISTLNVLKNFVIGTLSLEYFPISIALSPDERFLYISTSIAGNGVVRKFQLSTQQNVATIPVGRNPYAMALSADGKLFVANAGSSSVSKINTSTDSVTATIGVGSTPRGLAVRQNKVYVTNALSNTTSIIDATTNTVTATERTAMYPFGAAVFPTNSQPLLVYVNDGDELAILQYPGHNVVARLPVNIPNEEGIPFQKITATPNGRRVFITNPFSTETLVIDGTSLTQLPSLMANSAIKSITHSPDSRFTYFLRGSDAIEILDNNTNTIIESRPLPGPNDPKAFTHGGITIVVSNTLTAISSNTLLPIYPLESAAGIGEAVSPRGDLMYGRDPQLNFQFGFTAFSFPNLNQSLQMPVGFPDFFFFMFSQDGSRGYAATFFPTVNTLIFDTTTHTQVGRLDVLPWDAALKTDQRNIYLLEPYENCLSVLDSQRDEITKCVPVGTSPVAMDLAPDGSLAYVVNKGGNSISVLETQNDTVWSTISNISNPHLIEVAIDPR